MALSKVKLMVFIILIFNYFFDEVFANNMNPCSVIDRSLSIKEKQEFSGPVAKALRKDMKSIKDIEILSSFKIKKWRIFYVNTHISDETYLFYSDDPKSHKFVAKWSGAVPKDEKNGLHAWVIKNVNGIPEDLVKCFVWQMFEE